MRVSRTAVSPEILYRRVSRYISEQPLLYLDTGQNAESLSLERSFRAADVASLLAGTITLRLHDNLEVSEDETYADARGFRAFVATDELPTVCSCYLQVHCTCQCRQLLSSFVAGCVHGPERQAAVGVERTLGSNRAAAAARDCKTSFQRSGAVTIKNGCLLIHEKFYVVS